METKKINSLEQREKPMRKAEELNFGTRTGKLMTNKKWKGSLLFSITSRYSTTNYECDLYQAGKLLMSLI